MAKGTMLLAAGGTGGHLFPAEALAHELRGRGWSVHLVTDARAARFAQNFPAEDIHVVEAATFGSKNPLALLKSGWTIWRGVKQASKVLQKLKPAAVVGFGGYPTLPPLFAATRRGVPSLVHEQNAVMGRANKALAGRVQAIAGGFLKPAGLHAGKIVPVGNPVRQAVLDVADAPYDAPAEGGPFRLLVFGGSQGARFFSDTMPEVMALMPELLRARLTVTHQARPEDEERVRARYREIGVKAEVAPFFGDLPARMAGAHLVVSRAGASTVLELSVIGRPSVLVPLPHALDDDQGHNAGILVDAGGALLRRQAEIDVAAFAAELTALLGDGARLAAMAAGAKSVGRTDATRLLADLAEAIASGTPIAIFMEGNRA
ncbi:undecaprenyldiphospho-muramoylpentapeptide beta-N-acetylglucosaminyltransferase [Nitratireductor pacificus]|uniref:UDP-N-acetylglucosamine--N-acetylmuramyl-(pentapeptide) pyrophosphoryl-undecaprenol N-acetylglucosamine transferase n=1 Tax=Nitratireductor pacificus pht-3B TaxID=391937 RepID=K2LSR3_9HYPH|nr:undecaprenyldiphospho-muramoylpentapeptide beta-N-acetylglucosaminyltransferase [Nitratireductor pacificus]EKF20804.1 undecaprenyldiphospho-muramoylpentapeptide beta-N- acetylglucosaminyltransferase [Nitratireductor pacificus pht-3B]